MRSSAYTRTAMLLHGLMALLMVVGFTLGLYMVGLQLSPLKHPLLDHDGLLGRIFQFKKGRA